MQDARAHAVGHYGGVGGGVTIDKLKAATNVACDELNTEKLNWIKQSSLIERAYFLGLVIGLSEFAQEGTESDYLNQFLIKKMMGTLWERRADNNFRSTKVGAYFEELSDCTNLKTHEESSMMVVIESLRIHIEALDRKWSNQMECAKIILGQNQSIDEIARRLDELEKILRVISIIEGR